MLHIAMQQSVDVRGGQYWRAAWHAEYGNPVAKLDVSIDQPLKQVFDESIEWLTGPGGKRRHA
ncbi:MAG: hypothetical protein HY655_04655, partial [Acidobacteria bacterium]|nr:hypothetical protein [Acidobacteriota bacterium]